MNWTCIPDVAGDVGTPYACTPPDGATYTNQDPYLAYNEWAIATQLHYELMAARAAATSMAAIAMATAVRRGEGGVGGVLAGAAVSDAAEAGAVVGAGTGGAASGAVGEGGGEDGGASATDVLGFVGDGGEKGGGGGAE
jgi:hypothetical protein